MSLTLLNFLLGSIFGILLKFDFKVSILVSGILIVLIMFKFSKKKIIYFFLAFVLFYLIANFDIPNLDKNFNDEITIISKKTNYYIGLYKFNKIIIYTDDDFNLLEIIKVKGTLSQLQTNKSQLIKSFNDYLNQMNIHYSLKIQKYEVINQGDFIKPIIKKYLLSGVSENSKGFINLMVLGDKSLELDLYNNLTSLGIVHLFAISGFHLNILYKYIKKIFKKSSDFIATILLLPYLYLLDFSIPVMRAFLFLLLKNILKKRNISSFNILMFIALLFLIIDYTCLFNLSYQLTFLCNSIIIVLGSLPYNQKLKDFLMPLAINICIFPIIINMNYETSLLSFIYVLLLTTPVSIIYIFSFVTSLIKITDPLYKIVCTIFKKIIDITCRLDINVIWGKMNEYLIIVYISLVFIILYFSFIKQKKIVLLSSLVLMFLYVIQYYKNELFRSDEVIFIDVGQGDSTLICGKNNPYNVLIDTGGQLNKDIASSTLIPLLKAKGIKKLDYCIITHDDYDHSGALDSLNDNFKIDRIEYSYNINSLNINGLELTNLNHFYTYKSEDNSKSGVFYFKNSNFSYLIMGDAPVDIEEKIIKKYELDVDVLRIGHHGSDTSSSYSFLKKINPDYAIISVGYNKYGHPCESVINNINKLGINLYRTDKSHNIYFSNNYIIEKY